MKSQEFNWNSWLLRGSILGESGKGYQIGLGPHELISNTVPVGGQSWYFSPFFNDKTSGYYRSAQDKFVGHIPELFPLIPSLAGKDWSQPSLKNFSQWFEEAKSQMSAGLLEKVVPVVFEACDFEVTPEILNTWIYRAQLSHVSGHIYGCWDLEAGWGVLGLTPEVLFEIRGDQLTTMALAGTAKNMDHNLLEDNKERREHQIVIDEIVSELSPYGALILGETREWVPSSLKHLRTDISLKVKDKPMTPPLAMHPTPALGGRPKQISMELLRKWDKQGARRSFGAPFGYYDNGDSLFVVGIRSMMWKAGVLKIGSGCGLVRESELEQEWAELQRKRQAVKQVFGIHE